jgi:hypothetical protein
MPQPQPYPGCENTALGQLQPDTQKAVTPGPMWMLVLRGVQLVFALAILALCGVDLEYGEVPKFGLAMVSQLSAPVP